MRGEYQLDLFWSFFYHGSSPRAWGIHSAELDAHFQTRFIPTCVGNTDGDGCNDLDNAVHPHVRGEY